MPERRSGQTALYHTGRLLIQLLAPVLAFTSEESWQYLPKKPGDPESVHLLNYDDLSRFKEKDENVVYENIGWNSFYEIFLKIRPEVLKKIEEVRTRGEVGSSLEAKVEITASNEGNLVILNALKKWKDRFGRDQLAESLIVSEVEVFAAEKMAQDGDLKITVSRTNLPKCPRCWVHSREIGQSSEYQDLCPKCADAVSKLQQP